MFLRSADISACTPHERSASLSSSLLSVIPGGKVPAYRDSDPLVDENLFRLEM